MEKREGMGKMKSFILMRLSYLSAYPGWKEANLSFLKVERQVTVGC